MMFKWNRAIAAIVSTAMLFTAMPLGAFAADLSGAEGAESSVVEAAAEEQEAMQEAEAAATDAQETVADTETTEASETVQEAADEEAPETMEAVQEAVAAEAPEAAEALQEAATEEIEEEATEAEEAAVAADAEITEEASEEAGEDAQADAVPAATEEVLGSIPASYEEYPFNAGDSDALFEEYANRLFFGNKKVMLRSVKATGSRLEGQNKVIYDAVKERAVKVAAGEEPSTVVQIPLEDLGVSPDKQYSAEELGVDYIYDFKTREFNNEEVPPAMMKNFSFDRNLIQNTLFADCPYELYWARSISFPTVVGVSIQAKTDSLGNVTAYAVFSEPYLEISINVESKYQDGDEHTADRAKTGAAANAASYARTIVSEAAGMSDYDKLVYYKDKICELVTYDEDARTNSSTMEDRGPWALIHVFDRDDETNVVCEGYSEAFQYLCDLTDFDDDSICAYCVTGKMEGGQGGGGDHKWNIVHMDDGYNYIADITNSDEGAWGEDESLFLKGMRGSVEVEYIKFRDGWEEEGPDGTTIVHPEGFINYTYDEDTRSIFTVQELTLSAKDYGQNIPLTTDNVAELLGISLFLTEKIGMRIHVRIDTDHVAPDDYIQFDYNGNTEKQTVEDGLPSPIDDKIRIFELPLTTTQMTVPVTFKMVVGGKAGTEKTYSIKSYAAEILRVGGGYTAKEKAMAEAMLHYGSFAQQYVGENTEDLPDDGEGFDWQDADLESLSKYKYTLDSNIGESLHLYSASMILGTDISARFYFDLADGAKLEDYDISVTNQKGQNVGFGTGYNADKGKYYVTIEHIRPFEIGHMFRLKVSEGGTQIVDMNYGPLSYCYNKISNAKTTEKIKNLCKGMYKYHLAAEALKNEGGTAAN